MQYISKRKLSNLWYFALYYGQVHWDCIWLLQLLGKPPNWQPSKHRQKKCRLVYHRKPTLTHLNLIALSVVGLSSSFERRWFSQVMRRCVPKGPAQFSRPAQPPDRSLRIAAKEMMAMPSDLGLLEGEHDRSTSNPTNMHLTDLQRHSSPHLAAIFPRSFTHLGRF
jgi:hypothetical protein